MTHRKEASEKIAKYLLHLTNREALFNKMGSLEKLCLRWNDFGGNVSRSFASIRESNQFFDCTLTTEDDDDDAYSEYLRAHKIILSASSDFFRKVLTREYMCTNPNPVMYLRGISAKDLKWPSFCSKQQKVYFSVMFPSDRQLVSKYLHSVSQHKK